jgi:aminopeptidase N
VPLQLNAGRYGFYRVNYPVATWLAIGDQICAPPGVGLEFQNSDLVGFINDVWTLALAGQTTYAAAFNLTQFLGVKTNYAEYTPWAATLSQLGRVSRLLDSKPTDTTLFNQYVVTKLINQNSFSTPPWDGYDDHMQNLLQASFVSALVAYGDAASRTFANDQFTAFMNHGVTVPVNVRDAVYRVGIEEGGPLCWTFLYEQYRTTLDPSEARRILRALTRSLDPTYLKQILDWSLDTSRIKSQDTSRIIIYVAYNRIGKDLAWTWIQANYAELFNRFGKASFTLAELITKVIGLFQSQAELDSARAFFADKDLGTAKRALLQAYEAVETNIYWLAVRYPEFSAALQATIQAS